MYRVTKRFRFEAAHQLSGAHSTACTDCVHGHSYVVEVTLASECLNTDLMVIDFGYIKEAIEAIREEWDHALLLPPSLFLQYRDTPSRKIVEMVANPTAELMAACVFERVSTALTGLIWTQGTGLRVQKVRVQETENGWAEYEPA